MTAAFDFDVFLSHNSQDKPQVEQIAKRLVSEAKLQPFLDKWHLVPGDEWQAELTNALERSATVAVFFGLSGNGPWHHEEMQVALMRAVREKKEFRVIPVLLPQADASSIPAFLQLRTWVDFSAGITSDIAFKRLVAGIRGQATDFEGIELPDEPAPYRGLMQFESEHARFFFGREQEIGPTKDKPNLVDKLRVNRFVAVVGSSGSGKSSIVRAGLLPRLDEDAIPGSRHWRTITFTPFDASARRGAEGTRRPPAGRGIQAVRLVFEVAHFQPLILAEGHIYRSLGQRPRNTREHPLFGRRPYSPPCIGQGEHGLRPEKAGQHRCPGAVPQATVGAGLRPSLGGLPKSPLQGHSSRSELMNVTATR